MKKFYLLIILILVLLLGFFSFFVLALKKENSQLKNKNEITQRNNVEYKEKNNKLEKELENSTKNKTDEISDEYLLKDDKCLESQCLFLKNSKFWQLEWPFGIAKIKGYYKKRTFQTKPFGCEENSRDIECAKVSSEVCDSFVVLDGYEKIIPEKFTYEEGKTVNLNLNKFDDSLEKVIGENLSALTTIEKQKIINSTKNKPVELLIFIFKPELDTETNACYSFFHILKVL